MVKNVKLFNANFKWHLRILSVAKAQNINSAPLIRGKGSNQNMKYFFPRGKISWQSIVWSGPVLAMSRLASLKVLVWLRSGAGQHSIIKKFVCGERNFFYKFRKIHRLVTSFQKDLLRDRKQVSPFCKYFYYLLFDSKNCED